MDHMATSLVGALWYAYGADQLSRARGGHYSGIRVDPSKLLASSEMS